jgi:hypothetical protein
VTKHNCNQRKFNGQANRNLARPKTAGVTQVYILQGVKNYIKLHSKKNKQIKNTCEAKTIDLWRALFLELSDLIGSHSPNFLLCSNTLYFRKTWAFPSRVATLFIHVAHGQSVVANCRYQITRDANIISRANAKAIGQRIMRICLGDTSRVAILSGPAKPVTASGLFKFLIRDVLMTVLKSYIDHEGGSPVLHQLVSSLPLGS